MLVVIVIIVIVKLCERKVSCTLEELEGAGGSGAGENVLIKSCAL